MLGSKIRLMLKRASPLFVRVKGNNPILPFGVFTSLVKPALFTSAVIGGSLAAAEYAIHLKRQHGPLIDFNIFPEEWVPPSKRLVYSIIAANAVVFLVSHNPALGRFMIEFFNLNIHNRRLSPFILSCFNHAGALHFAINMYVLSNFLPHVQEAVGPERTLALFIAGCATSSFASHLVRLLQRSTAYSVGASGGICAVVAAFCIFYPTIKVHPIGLPSLGLNASDALLVFAALETSLLVLFRGRLPIDFAAHLGGFAFGAAYASSLVELSKYARRRGFFN